MSEDYINHPYITQYIRKIIPKRDSFFSKLEEYAQENHVPIIQPEVAQLLRLQLRLLKPKRVLEIGTAIGYSALIFAEELDVDGKIDTIERYDKMVMVSRANIEVAEMSDVINVIEGEAEEILPKLDGMYDFVFLDAAKGQYPEFLPHCIRLLRPGGLLISDNVLYKGMIASDHLVIRRKITIVKRMRAYLNTIMEHEELESTVIPVGDGVALSIKKG